MILGINEYTHLKNVVISYKKRNMTMLNMKRDIEHLSANYYGWTSNLYYLSITYRKNDSTCDLYRDDFEREDWYTNRTDHMEYQKSKYYWTCSSEWQNISLDIFE